MCGCFESKCVCGVILDLGNLCVVLLLVATLGACLPMCVCCCFESKCVCVCVCVVACKSVCMCVEYK